ncbi:NAD-dependent epimerase/dehydratase family protein [Candidatus Woesearchaeota archaeon]|jgi:dTDP-6-deoxy-L-talose 4-dehydrogenase (NAD+)|nr:NAD-dependent epimerase/dehydratase family protein [Candidatus Woesearchaeota archaeon]MBT7555848.1 NAD-dependent epimerase/dehydratase family protein [Candidatus Woesearchaeota archaeon]
MKVLVTGATGFIGSHLIRELLKSKTNQIVATSRSIDKAKKSDWFSKVEYIEYDFNEGTGENLYDFFGKPDQLIHLAWEDLSDYSSPSHIDVILPNHCEFIESMVVGGLKDVVVTGTCFEYGMIEGCLSEDIDTKPENPYAVAKDSLRKFIVNLQKKHSFVYKWIRLFYMYGDGQSKTSLMYLLDKTIQDKNKVFNMSGGEQLRDFLPIDEVVRNISLITKQNSHLNQVVNCCSGKPISVKNLVEHYLEEKKYKIRLNLGFYPYPDYEPMRFWGCNLKLKEIQTRMGNNEK